MVGKKIRACRELVGLNQIQLADLSGINVGTIRKYELGIRNPKPDQLEKIASALGINVSVFLDFKIKTVGDVLTLLFAIDDSVELTLSQLDSNETNSGTVCFSFKNKELQKELQKWCQYKNAYEDKSTKIKSNTNGQNNFADWEDLKLKYETLKLKSMCNQTPVDKKLEEIVIQTSPYYVTFTPLSED